MSNPAISAFPSSHLFLWPVLTQLARLFIVVMGNDPPCRVCQSGLLIRSSLAARYGQRRILVEVRFEVEVRVRVSGNC